jgi:type IV secretion system protein VirD4
VLDGSLCVLQVRGVRPFLSKKYDITKHPLYKQLYDHDKRNIFEAQKYLNTRLSLKDDDEFEVYELNPLVPPDEAAS